MPTESARLPQAKIEFACTCGKKYRVPVTKAGKKIKCKRCGVRVQVPEDASVSGRSRQAILEELGIDPLSAGEAYTREKERRAAEKAKEGAYHCSICELEIVLEDLKTSYCEDGLVCPLCREQGETQKPKVAAVVGPSHETPLQSLKNAAFYFGLFTLGFAGPLVTFTSMGKLGALAVAIPLAVIGAWLVYSLRRAVAETGVELVSRRKRKDPAPEANDNRG